MGFTTYGCLLYGVVMDRPIEMVTDEDIENILSGLYPQPTPTKSMQLAEEAKWRRLEMARLLKEREILRERVDAFIDQNAENLRRQKELHDAANVFLHRNWPGREE